MAVGQESIPKTCLFILLEDNNLKRHKSNAHCKHILPTLDAAAAAPVNQAETVDVLRLLGTTMMRSSKAAEAQDATQRKQLDYSKEKDKKKKDKAKKWHGLNQCLVLNAVSADGQLPVTEISDSYQNIINSKTAAMVDKELHGQMVAIGHPDVGFAHGTAASLYNGSILWQERDRPSNFSFFTLYKNNPLSKIQTLHYLSLNILSLNIDNKNINKIKTSQKTNSHGPKRLSQANQRHQNVPQYVINSSWRSQHPHGRNWTGHHLNQAKSIHHQSQNCKQLPIPSKNSLRLQDLHPTLALTL
jgi:hypothetical protein